MLMTPWPMVTLVRFVQYSNARSPMLVTLLGIVTLARLLREIKALDAMLVTGRPVIWLGIISAPPGPL